jgi:hypothetical protein
VSLNNDAASESLASMETPSTDVEHAASARAALAAIAADRQRLGRRAISSLLDLSEATLSKTIRNLADLGYVHTSKQASAARDDAGRTTTVALTPRGRAAIDGHLAALREIAAHVVAPTCVLLSPRPTMQPPDRRTSARGSASG